MKVNLRERRLVPATADEMQLGDSSVPKITHLGDQPRGFGRYGRNIGAQAPVRYNRKYDKYDLRSINNG